MRELLAGGARRDITPESGLLQYNGPLLEPGDGAPLTVSALCVQCGDTAAALVSVDTLFVDRAQVLQMRQDRVAPRVVEDMGARERRLLRLERVLQAPVPQAPVVGGEVVEA